MWPFSSGSASSSSARDDASSSACPVDHTTRQQWLEQNPNAAPPHASGSRSLSEERVISSIPRHFVGSAGTPAQEPVSECPNAASRAASSPAPAPEKEEAASARSHWVYPSPSQFHAALMRKGHQSAASGANMDVVVPIHNAVNERCWEEILQWEKTESAAGAASWVTCGGPKLVSFKGRPSERTWKAWFKGILGYQAPFDRHDWVVDRCGHRMRYIIDFYAGRQQKLTDQTSSANHPFLPGVSSTATSSAPKMSFYLDVRPAPDTLEGIGMRMKRIGKEALAVFGLGESAAAPKSTSSP